MDVLELDDRALLRAYARRAAEVAVTRGEEAALRAFTTLGPMEEELLRRLEECHGRA
jgi:hypothetical protein